MTTSDAKRITFNRTTKDYDATFDGQYIGSFANHHQAKVALNDYALDLIEQGLVDTAEGITTMQWQAPRTLADVAADRARHTTDSADDPFNDGPSQAEQAASAARWKECAGGWEQYTPDPFDPSKTVRLFMPRLDVVYARPAEAVELLHSDDPTPTGQEPGGSGGGGGSPLQRWRDQGAREQSRIATLPHFNLPAAPPAVETIVRTSDTFSGLETSTAAGREDAAPMSGHFLACTVCGGPHVPTQCPEVALAKYGMGIWEAYMEDRAAFLKLVQRTTAARLALMGDAVAFYLSHRWGHTITGYQVLACWAHRNTASA